MTVLTSALDVEHCTFLKCDNRKNDWYSPSARLHAIKLQKKKNLKRYVTVRNTKSLFFLVKMF